MKIHADKGVFEEGVKLVVTPITSSNNPQTGDDSHTMLWLALLLASASMICGIAIARKRQNV